MPSYNNVVTTDGYQTFRFYRTQRVTIAVSNNPILAQFAPVSIPGDLYDSAYDFEATERDMANGAVYGWTPSDFPNSIAIAGLRIKSEILATPAVVTIHA